MPAEDPYPSMLDRFTSGQLPLTSLG
jgi:hypothetical protein